MALSRVLKQSNRPRSLAPLFLTMVTEHHNCVNSLQYLSRVYLSRPIQACDAVQVLFTRQDGHQPLTSPEVCCRYETPHLLYQISRLLVVNSEGALIWKVPPPFAGPV